MLTRHKLNLVPSTYIMEIFESQDGDPTYQHTRPDGVVVPMGISVAKLHQQFDGDEGDITAPTGEIYHISLASWEGKDPEKTLLHMIFHATPLLPVDIAPELRPSRLFHPPTTPQQGTEIPSASLDNTNTSSASSIRKRSPLSLFNYISCSDVRREHRIKIQHSGSPDRGVTAEMLLSFPEMTLAEVHCPVCDTPIPLIEPLARRLPQGIEWWGNEAKIQVIFEHPVDIEETRTADVDTPFVVHRYHRYTPVFLPTQQKDPDRELSIVQKIHNHLVMVTSDAGETTAQTLLALPEAQQTEVLCPLCDEKLSVKEPFEKYIRILADDAADEKIHIQWSISHPNDCAETKAPSKEDAIVATRHAANDDFVQKRYEGSACFVVRKNTQA